MRYQIDGVYGEIDSLPGCTQVAVSHAVFLPPKERGKGKGTAANAKRLIMMQEELGYDYALCTVSADNHIQRELLQANHWMSLSSFYSRKTGHLVFIYGIQL